MINIKKELIQGVYTLNKSLFNALEIFRRYDSGYRIKRKELLVENTVFVYAEFYTVTSEKFIYLICIADRLCKLLNILLCHYYHSNH